MSKRYDKIMLDVHVMVNQYWYRLNKEPRYIVMNRDTRTLLRSEMRGYVPDLGSIDKLMGYTVLVDDDLTDDEIRVVGEA